MNGVTRIFKKLGDKGVPPLPPVMTLADLCRPREQFVPEPKVRGLAHKGKLLCRQCCEYVERELIVDQTTKNKICVGCKAVNDSKVAARSPERNRINNSRARLMLRKKGIEK